MRAQHDATRCNRMSIETSSVFAQRNRLAGQWTILIHMHETQALQNLLRKKRQLSSNPKNIIASACSTMTPISRRDNIATGLAAATKELEWRHPWNPHPALPPPSFLVLRHFLATSVEESMESIVLPWAVQVSLSLSLIVTDMMLAAFPVFLRAGKEQELQQHLHGKLWKVAMHQETHNIVILSCIPSSGTFCRLNSQIVRHFGEVVVLCVVQNFASITWRLGSGTLEHWIILCNLEFIWIHCNSAVMRSGTLLHRSLLLRQFPIIDIKAASMLQAKPARLSAYYIQDHSSTLAGCSQYFSMFPNSDSLSRSLALPGISAVSSHRGRSRTSSMGLTETVLWHWERMNAMQNL